MKKVLAVVAATGILAAASFATAGTIVGSKHDMSNGNAYSGTSTQICIYCHAPHNAQSSLPLWNRINPTASAFTLYSGVGMQSVSFKSGFTADSTSLFCMSCHDGNTVVGAVHNAGTIDGTALVAVKRWTAPGGTFGTTAIAPASPSAFTGGDLSKTHPINFPVVTVNDPTQNDLNVGTGPAMGPGVATGITWTTKTYPLFKSTDSNILRSTTERSLECGSCHSVHDSTDSPFLRDTMTKSKLCLGCHNK